MKILPALKPSTVVAILLAASTALGQGQRDLLLIGNKSDDTLSFVDVGTLNEVAKTTTGRGPHEVTVTPDGKKAFVSNYEGAGDTISVVDVAARKELRRIPLGEHRAPHGIAVNRDGTKLYATCERSQTVIEIDVATEKILRAFKTDQKGTHMLALTADGKKLYTGNMGSGSSTVIDLVKGEVLAQIKTGANCEGIDITPDGKQVWTTANAADTLCVIDTETDRVIATIPCKGFPIRVKFTPDGKRALVPCARSDELAVFDVTTRQETKRLSTGGFPVGVLIEPNGARAFVAYTADSTVAVYDLATLAVVGKIAAGKQADGMALVTQKRRVGVYNSRAVALAYGRSNAHRERVEKFYAEVREAKASGDKNRLAELEKEGPALQDQLHRQVFGNAPIDDILKNLKVVLPGIQAEANVQTMAPEAPQDPLIETVDITSLLVEQFHPTKETLKMIEELEKHPPLSLDRFPIKD